MMMGDEIITPLHLQTIEKYMANTSESVQKLADSVNELVIAERERTVRDEQIKKEIEEIKSTLKTHKGGLALASWLYKLFDNYIMRIGFPFVMTLIFITLAANFIDISAFTGGK